MRDPLRQMRKWADGGLIRDCCENECGATMIEYSLLIGLISAVVIIAVAVVRDSLAVRWETLVDTLAIVVW